MIKNILICVLFLIILFLYNHNQNTNTNRNIVNTDVSQVENNNFQNKKHNTKINVNAGNFANIPEKNFTDLPDYAQHAVIFLKANNFSAPENGYVGGRIFTNYEKVLPNFTKNYYKEWDVHKKINGVNRGKERLVTGQNGEIYFTDTHYGEAGTPAFYEIKM